MKVLFAGTYPTGTFEKIQKQLGQEILEIETATTQEELAQAHDVDAVVLRVLKMSKPVIDGFSDRLKLILRWGVGFDSVDIEAAGKRGIPVCNTPGANANAVSELTVLLMLAIGRKLFCHQLDVRAGKWSKNTYLNSSRTLNHKVVGIVGGGNIGRQVARKVQAFGASVLYYDVFRLKPDLEEAFQMKFVSLDELLQQSDVVSVHVPLLDSTKNIISAEKIAKMKQGAILINAARGGLVDEKALVAAINAGKLAGAGIDCVAHEPLQSNDPLLSNPNILVTPHVAGGVGDIGDEIIPMLVANMQHLKAGEAYEHVVNSQFLA